MVNELQIKWLNAMGGRTPDHVQIDPNGGYYVFMGKAGGGDKRVYIPSDEEIIAFFKHTH